MSGILSDDDISEFEATATEIADRIAEVFDDALESVRAAQPAAKVERVLSLVKS